MNIILEKARSEDASDIANLINLAYRGKEGWTTETALISGERTSEKSIESLLSDDNIHFLVAYNLGDLLACICVEKSSKVANIGFFSVSPRHQTLGIGKTVLDQAEHYTSKVLKLKKCVMQVVEQRSELVAFYQRRGYQLMGLIKPYPKNLNSGKPIDKALKVVYLEKNWLEHEHSKEYLCSNHMINL